MSYLSYQYLILFLGTVFAVYTAVPKRFQWMVLLAASYVFYWSNSKALLFFLLLTTVTIYFSGILLNRIEEGFVLSKKALEKADRKRLKALIAWQKKAVVCATVLFEFSFLLVLKYYHFFTETVISLFSLFHTRAKLPEIWFLLPLGISYYTLQAAGYLIDVYRGKYKACEQFGKVALFLSFFPQIVEGPIGRFDLLGDPLYEGHSFNYDRVTQALQRIVWGLFKKIVIADRVNLFVATVFENFQTFEGSILLLGGMLYTLQIYAEFSGCMDIVSGSAQLFGVPLAENFARPFFAKSVPEFWRRWHITLGNWLKDYVFYPISLSRPCMRLSKFARRHFNETAATLLPAAFAMFFVWLGMGFWHGAGWKYLVYGLYYYILMLFGMCTEPLWVKIFAALQIKRHNRFFNLLSRIRTFAFVVIGMMLFRADTVEMWGSMIKRIFTTPGISSFANTVLTCGMDQHDFIIVSVGVVFLLAVGLLQERGVAIRQSLSHRALPVRWAVYAALVLAVIIFGAYGPGYEPVDLIYGQF